MVEDDITARESLKKSKSRKVSMEHSKSNGKLKTFPSEINIKKLKILEDFYNRIKAMVRNCGRTNVILVSDLDEELVNTGNKLFELK